MKYLFGIFGSTTSKALLIFLLLFVFADVLKPQQSSNNVADGQISGIFIDFHTREPLEFVNFILTSLKDSSLITGITSGKDGRFLLKGVAYGSYKAKVSLMGYKTRTRSNMVLSPKQHTIQLDTIFLLTKEILTEEVKIVSDKYPIVYEKDNKDKLIISPDRNWGNNAYELLESAPMIDVDIETGAIKILGKRGTTIYIDGMPAKFSGIEQPEDLKTLPFYEIDKIEIVLDPLAEYGENSGGGIINIITKPDKKVRYSGNVGLTVDNDNSLSANSSIRYNPGKLSLSGSYRNSYSKHQTNTSTFKSFNYENNATYINQSLKSSSKSNNNSYSFGARYPFDSTNSLSFNSRYYEVNSNNDRMIENTNLDQYYMETNLNTSNKYSRTLQGFFTNSISYTKKFKGKGNTPEGQGNTLSAAVNYIKNRMIVNDEVTLQQAGRIVLTDYRQLQKNSSENFNNSLYWKLSYQRPFIGNTNINGSYTGSYKWLVMNSNYTYHDTLKQLYVGDVSKKIGKNYFENEHNLSLSGSGSVYGVGYGLGFTVSKTINIIENAVLDSKEKTHAFSFQPSLNLSTSILENGYVFLLYNRGTRYPLNKQLNPNVDYSDSTNIVVGNPNLKPEISNRLWINCAIMEGSFSGGFDLFYSLITDGIQPVSFLTNPKVMQTTYENLTTTKSYSFDLYLRNKFFEWLIIEPRFSANRDEVSSSFFNSKGSGWNSSLRTTIAYNNYRFQINFQYTSPSTGSQVIKKESFYANASAKVLLFNKDLSLTLRVTDIFNTKNNNYDNRSVDFAMINRVKEITQKITLDLSYYFQSKANDSLEESQSDEVPDDF
ncbi:MAG: outer membrane beta-barrel protein [Ignavibacteria bacterium]|nr:outer membrane beta-barrel protein [Ignavibacteria bacterium]